MGVLNITPDSFSDGGLYLNPEAALTQAQRMVEEGADIVDVGGESSRPGAEPVSLDEELSRVLPVLDRLHDSLSGFPLSIDTTKAIVAQEALARGAVLVNDISGARADPKILEVVKTSGAGIVLMHRQGLPRSMQARPHYRDVVEDICTFFHERLAAACALGISEDAILLDPGIGFGKTVEHNLKILANLEEFQRFRRPLVVGTSRKSFIGQVLGKDLPLSERLEGTLASCLWAASKSARVLRVHDVKACRRALTMWEKIQKQEVRNIPNKDEIPEWTG